MRTAAFIFIIIATFVLSFDQMLLVSMKFKCSKTLDSLETLYKA